MREVLTRALRALAVSPLNCSLILDAGGLEALTDMLCGRDQELAHQALVVLSLLSKVRPQAMLQAAAEDQSTAAKLWCHRLARDGQKDVYRVWSSLVVLPPCALVVLFLLSKVRPQVQGLQQQLTPSRVSGRRASAAPSRSLPVCLSNPQALTLIRRSSAHPSRP